MAHHTAISSYTPSSVMGPHIQLGGPPIQAYWATTSYQHHAYHADT